MKARLWYSWDAPQRQTVERLLSLNYEQATGAAAVDIVIYAAYAKITATPQGQPPYRLTRRETSGTRRTPFRGVRRFSFFGPSGEASRWNCRTTICSGGGRWFGLSEAVRQSDSYEAQRRRLQLHSTPG